jgi:predicted transcriptional regulator
MAQTPQVSLKVFRKALQGAGISLSAFAREAAISRPHLYHVLHGARKPGPVLAARIRRLIKDYAA